jgi:UDPglucose 6-dehydrogenase
MKVSVIGSGYVGLVTGACLADVGNDVLCVDIDAAKVARLQAGDIPIYEPGLDAIVRRNTAAGRLCFTTDPAEGARFGLVQMIAVGTPPGEDGSADLTHVLSAARSIARNLCNYAVIVDKSTVPVGTADRVEGVIREELAARGAELSFSVVSNPEFLKEGAAIEDFTRPDRIVLGVDGDARAEHVMRELYGPFQRNHDRTLVMGRRSAELTKYAANAMLATRISFMNELANLAERAGADIDDVRRGIGSDPRIGFGFLYAGTGYGGSCFPKDVKALARTGREAGIGLRILDAVETVNEAQKTVLVDKARRRFGSLMGRHFALWGLSFKPDTDDIREAPSLSVIEALLGEGATVAVFDPVAMREARRHLGDRQGLAYRDSAAATLDGADALLILTEWKEFRSSDFTGLKAALRQPVVFDGRNLYDPYRMAERGFEYYGIGRGKAHAT